MRRGVRQGTGECLVSHLVAAELTISIECGTVIDPDAQRLPSV